MSWLNPSALFALAAIAAPILIHILVQRRAERFPFPTLRFLQPTRLAAIRRHLLEDPGLLAIRIGVLAAAVVALAGPLLVTAARRRAWDNRLAQAIVIDDDATTAATGFPSGNDRPGATLQQRFEGSSLPDGIRRAILWLETTPPARREIVIASALPIGSITPADVAAIPTGIGVRFERRPTLPATRTAPGGRLLTPTGVRAREVTLSGERTSFRDMDAGDPAVWPIEIVASAADKPALDAAAVAVLSRARVGGAAGSTRASGSHSSDADLRCSAGLQACRRKRCLRRRPNHRALDGGRRGADRARRRCAGRVTPRHRRPDRWPIRVGAVAGDRRRC